MSFRGFFYHRLDFVRHQFQGLLLGATAVVERIIPVRQREVLEYERPNRLQRDGNHLETVFVNFEEPDVLLFGLAFGQRRCHGATLKIKDDTSYDISLGASRGTWLRNVHVVGAVVDRLDVRIVLVAPDDQVDEIGNHRGRYEVLRTPVRSVLMQDQQVEPTVLLGA